MRLAALTFLAGLTWGQTLEYPDLRSVPVDLVTPEMVEGTPGPGKRVKQMAPEYEGTSVYHALYLPAEWKPGRKYPLIVEYAGNGFYTNQYGDVSTGKVEDSNLGYGISGGKRFIWISMPYVNSRDKRNQLLWWGDIDATVEYCKNTVHRVCENYGGDPSAVIIAGFSRGAIACNFIGLHDDEIADIWLAFIAHSHYDGVRKWDYAACDRESAIERLKRLRGRASFVSHERSVREVEEYLASTMVQAPFLLQAIPFRNHGDTWTLRDIPERRALRAWIEEVLEKRTGTSVVSGVVKDADGKPVAGARIESGYTHWTTSGTDGRYALGGLVRTRRTIKVSKNGYEFAPTKLDESWQNSEANFTALRPK